MDSKIESITSILLTALFSVIVYFFSKGTNHPIFLATNESAYNGRMET